MSVLVLASCEHDVAMETTVHEDGSLDKVFVFENEDASKNIVGLTEKTGWTKSVKQKENKPDTVKGKEVIVTFRKTFASAQEANTELAISSDTLFRVSATFEKKFRWFYTYLYYADTYHAVNRMKLPVNDYVTPEDYAFIDRLPAEGKPISKADSLYLSELNKKLFDIYGLKAIYEEYFSINVDLIKKYQLEARWLDTLNQHKNDLFVRMERSKDIEDNFMLDYMDSLHIPLPYKELAKEYKVLSKPVESKTRFISTANDGKYVHRINMPWTVINTNADSVINNQLVWRPPVIKFLIKDYTMYAEARQMNYWAVAVSAVLVGLTIYVFARKRNP